VISYPLEDLLKIRDLRMQKAQTALLAARQKLQLLQLDEEKQKSELRLFIGEMAKKQEELFNDIKKKSWRLLKLHFFSSKTKPCVKNG